MGAKRPARPTLVRAILRGSIMSTRSYDAILVDIDGTLLDEQGRIHPRTKSALAAAEAAGVRVMLSTGRSTISTRPVLAELGLVTPALVFNGAGLWCPRERRMLEEHVLSNRTLRRALRFGAERDLLTVLMTADAKLASPPRDALEEEALSGLHELVVVPREGLAAEFVMRVTFYSQGHASSQALADEVAGVIDQPMYVTHFPLNALATHRGSRANCLDLHPPCRGKAEGVRILEERYGIPAERVVAVGDATNDIPMFEAAGLAVAMQGSMPEALAAADRVIGDNSSTSLAELVEELFS
jgi:5-amino-6-(5-phospho-D-ribitylamino)uracil phosphatase